MTQGDVAASEQAEREGEPGWIRPSPVAVAAAIGQEPLEKARASWRHMQRLAVFGLIAAAMAELVVPVPAHPLLRGLPPGLLVGGFDLVPTAVWTGMAEVIGRFAGKVGPPSRSRTSSRSRLSP